MWVLFALLAALFAGLTSILARIGLEGINSHVAVAIRTVVVLVMAWGMVFLTGNQEGVAQVSQRNWTFLILSGVATGLSWMFYFRALQIGEVSRVSPIDRFSVVITMILAFTILGEAVSTKTVVGGILITIGTLVLAL